MALSGPIERVVNTQKLIMETPQNFDCVRVEYLHGIDNTGWEYKSFFDLETDPTFIAREIDNNMFARTPNGSSWGTVIANCAEVLELINEKYENMCAMDIKLWAAEEAVQPLVPVTIRMQLPESIDKEKSIKVLHFADGESEPEELESTVLDDEIEITAPGFSIFAIVNVADEIQDNQDVNQNDGLADNQEKDNSNSASSSNQISVEKSGNKTIIIVVLVVLLILSLAAGIVAAVVKFKKNNE